MTTTAIPDHVTDEALRDQLAKGERLGARGLVREADYLLRIRPELRLQAKGDAAEMSNMCPGYTYCDALSVVIEREAYVPHVA